MERPRNQFFALLTAICFTCAMAFSGNPAEENRDAVKKSLMSLADRAQEYYRKPIRLGGGEGSFATINLSTLTATPASSHGSFTLSSPTATSVVLTGTGVETGNDGSTPVEVEVIVYADSMTVTINN